MTADARLDDWSTISNELLQGLIHALNNRVAALGAVVELARLGGEENDPVAGFSEELAHLGQVNALFALLPERRSEPEALELSSALDDALRLHAHHPRLRRVSCEVRSDDDLAPVRAPRWALVRALVVLIHAAKRAGESVPDRVAATLELRAEGPDIVVRVRVQADSSGDLALLATLCGGRVQRDGEGIALRLPTLLELRRRERDMREGSDAMRAR